MSELKKGELNPMFNQIKSEAFIAPFRPPPPRPYGQGLGF